MPLVSSAESAKRQRRRKEIAFAAWLASGFLVAQLLFYWLAAPVIGPAPAFIGVVVSALLTLAIIYKGLARRWQP